MTFGLVCLPFVSVSLARRSRKARKEADFAFVVYVRIRTIEVDNIIYGSIELSHVYLVDIKRVARRFIA